jgi:hypothetical protein
MAALPERLNNSRWFGLLAGVGFCFLILWLTSACQTSCANNHTEPLPYKDGRTWTQGAMQYYESTPRSGEWLHFPGNRRFQLYHSFGTEQITSLTMFVAFASTPMPNGDAGDVAVASGDVAVVEQIAADYLQVYNDTCSEQYLWVGITAPAVSGNDAGTEP